MKTAAALLLLSAVVFAQASSTALDNLDEYVNVQRRYVSPEGLQHQQPAEVSKWVGIGREIGVATKEGLGAVVDEANRFGTTKVGTFVMFMITWKIIGNKVLAIVLGIPIFVAGVLIWLWSMRRFFYGRQVLDTYNETTKVRTYKIDRYQFSIDKQHDEGRTACALTHVIAMVVWCFLWIATIFWT